MKSDVLVYISGPMTAKDGYTVEENTAAGVRVYLELLKLGIPAFSPHLSGAFPSAWTALSHSEWIAYDCAILDRCTHLLLMPRASTSKGAMLELEYWLENYPTRNIAHSVDELARMVGARLTQPEGSQVDGSATESSSSLSVPPVKE